MEFLTGKDRGEGSGWSVRDRCLAEALTEHEESFCGGCGQKKADAWDENSNGWWEAHTVVCEACAALEVAKKDAKDREPGTLDYVTLGAGFKPSGPPLLKQDQAERHASHAGQKADVPGDVPGE